MRQIFKLFIVLGLAISVRAQAPDASALRYLYDTNRCFELRESIEGKNVAPVLSHAFDQPTSSQGLSATIVDTAISEWTF